MPHAFLPAMHKKKASHEAFFLECNDHDACIAANKVNCKVQIVPGLGHEMSEPKGPRKHPLLDSTLGSMSENFLNLRILCRKLLELLRIGWQKVTWSKLNENRLNS